MSLKLILCSSALLVLAYPFASFRMAAQDAPSVAEAARRARAKKQATTKPAPVITDDTFHLKPETPDSAVETYIPPAAGTPENAAPATSTAPESAAKKQPSESEEEKKAKLEALRKEIAQKQDSVALLQREITLEQSSFYRNPDYVHDTAGKAKLDSMHADLQQQQADLADLKARFAEMGGVEEPKTPASAPPQS